MNQLNALSNPRLVRWEQIRAVRKFAERAESSVEETEKAVESIKRRITQLKEEEAEEGGSPAISYPTAKDDSFDDEAIRNLFQSLLEA